MFLYGGNSCLSDMPQVTGTLRSSLLRHSKAFMDGRFTMKMYDEVFGDNMRQHFVNRPQEQKYLDDINDFERDGALEWLPEDHQDGDEEMDSDYGDDDDEEEESKDDKDRDGDSKM